MLTSNKLQSSIAEAKRFLTRAEELADLMDTDFQLRVKTAPDVYTYPTYFPKESGAVKRASLDLTRSLAQLRK